MQHIRLPRADATPPRPPQPKLDAWRGDIRRVPPKWRRRPRSEAMLELWETARPFLAQLGEGKSWE